MSQLYLCTKDRSSIDNKISLFYNLLSNNYYNDKLNTHSISYNIYKKVLHIFDDKIILKKNTNYDTFLKILNKHIYQTLNKNINEYINIMIKNNSFLKELFKYTDFQYYTNSHNEVLRLLSDNNTTENQTFNISKNYKRFKTKYINNQKHKRKTNINEETINNTKNSIFEIFTVIDGLEKLMFCRYNNLLKYDAYTFEQILSIIKQEFGTLHLNHNTPNTIYFKYKNNTLDYLDIYSDILLYPDLKDKIVLLFIQYVYVKYNETIDNITEYEKYREIIKNLYSQFLKDKEEDEDDEIINLSLSQKDEIIKKTIPKLYNKFNKNLLDNFKSPPVDSSKYLYTNILGNNVETRLEKIPISYVNNINLTNLKVNKSSNYINIHESDIIDNIIPKNDQHTQSTSFNIKDNEIINEANNRLEMISNNKNDVDYINHTIQFFKDNFEDEENLDELIKSITTINHEFINNFNIKVLVIKNTPSHNFDTHESNLINNIMKNENIDTPSKNTENINSNMYIISDYNILSPVYTSKFKIHIFNRSLTFKTLLHYIYFNKYLKLYQIYCKYTNNKEAHIIPTYKFAYNLLFKKSLYNINEFTKTILSSQESFKTYTELQESYYTLLNHIKYFLFKYEINNKINDDKIPYFNFILAYSDPLTITYSDKYDDYLGIGKYGKGENKVGLFLQEYRNNIVVEFDDYNHDNILLIMCDFNQNIFNWLKLKEDELYNTIICCCIITNTFNIDITFVNEIISKLYPSYNYSNIHKLPMIDSFKHYILNKLLDFSNFYHIDIHNISDNAIQHIWLTLLCVVQTLFDFQQKIIENSDNFQTFISLYDKHNIEHILYYILSLHNNLSMDDCITKYTEQKLEQLSSLSNCNPDINFYNYSLYILFNKKLDNKNFNTLVEEYNNSLEFDINGEQKYINIIKSKLKFKQK